MNRLDVSSVKTGLRFSRAVFFDDGKNMFIESGITVKPYHISALTRWNIPFLLTTGIAVAEGEQMPVEEEIEEISAFDDNSASVMESLEDAECLDEVEEIEEL
mgnify:FL=1